jgi:aerobic-type carbon monoxide dehydrogenase small subunit (CoxS/CutS family)
MSIHRLTINGKTHNVNVVSDMPLLWVLREVLDMTGTKYGCGIGVCGACTVHVNGKALRSCQVSVSECADKKITTIEGLSQDGSHPVQKAWVELNVSQCGYCQCGQIMTAAAFLQSNPKPNDQQINEAMAGNYCRCGTYLRIKNAIHKALEIMNTNK